MILFLRTFVSVERQPRNPVRTFRSNDTVPCLAKAESVADAVVVNFHERFPLVANLALDSRTGRDDLVARLSCNPVVVRAPVEMQLSVRLIIRRHRSGSRVGALGKRLATRDIAVGSRLRSPEVVGPLVMRELCELVFGHVQGLFYAVWAFEELRGDTRAVGGHACDELDEPGYCGKGHEKEQNLCNDVNDGSECRNFGQWLQ